MRILILSQWYAPEPDYKVHRLARELVARGHVVTAITGLPNYPSGTLYPGYRIRWRQWEHRDGVRVLRVPLYPDHSQSSGKRILNYLSFAASASLLGPLFCGPADVMWVYHPPLTVGIPAWWIGLLRRIPFIYEIQDMWPETIAATGMMSNSTAIHALGQLARGVYRQARMITVISPGFKRNLVAKGVPADKIDVMYNWADEDIYRPVPRDRSFAERFGLQDRFNVIFAGNMGRAQAMENVLAAAALLRDLTAVQFVLIGDGIDVPLLQKRAAEQGLANVRFIGRQPTEQMPDFFAWADALLVHLKRDPLFEITVPGKLTAYLACGRPILCTVPGDASEMVQDAGAGLICPPEDPAMLAQTVRTLFAMRAEEREAMAQSGRQAFLTNYTRARSVERYEQLFQLAASRRGSAVAPLPEQTRG